MLDGVDHVNLVVEDLAAMSSFYRDVLRLRLVKQATIRGRWIAGDLLELRSSLQDLPTYILAPGWGASAGDDEVI